MTIKPYTPSHSLALDAVIAALETAPTYSHTAWLRFVKALLERDIPARAGTTKASAA